MSKSEIINSASEDENHGAKESGNSHDKNMPHLTKLQPYPVYKPFVSKESPKKTNQEKNNQIRKKTAAKLEILSGALMVVQKAFAARKKKKFLRVISKVYFHLFWRYFYPVIY